MSEKRAIGEAQGLLVVQVALLLISVVTIPQLAILWVLTILFTLYFFRDPERVSPDDDELILAPADGKIVDIGNHIEDEVLCRRMVRISIFLSIVDVHVNRSPIQGIVRYSEARKGKYLDARDPRSNRENASRFWIIEGRRGPVGVRQITGAIARRIIAWAGVDHEVQAGEKIGMIRFGSRTELWVPEHAKVLVRVGESVRAGVTVMAQMPTHRKQPVGDAAVM